MISSSTQSVLDLTWERNYRVITDPETVKYKLQKQFVIAQLHMKDTPSFFSLLNPFKYSRSNISLPERPKLYTIQNLPVFDELSCTVEVAQFIGKKHSQEDAFIASSFKINTPSKQKHTLLLTGIFDGHGGDGAALFMKNNLKQKLEDTFEALFNKTLNNQHPLKVLENETTLSDAVIWNVLKIACVELHEEYPNDQDGTTASFSLLINGKDLWHANIGDSRSIITSKERTIQLSEDMKVRFNFPEQTNQDVFKKQEYDTFEVPTSNYAVKYPFKNHFERSIWKRGGFVAQNKLNGSLAMARSIGDKDLRSGLCPRPKIVKIPLDSYFSKSDSCLLLHASDGLWDAATTLQIANGINSDKDNSLARIATNLARSSIECDGFDNTSVVLTRIDLRALRET